MKAWFIEKRGTPSDLKQGEVQSLRGEIRVSVKGAALNPADLKVVRGKDGGKFLHANRFPIILGYDFAGVTERGDDVFGFLPYSMSNDQGSLAEWVLVPEASIGAKPKNISFPEAASLATASLTALAALRDRGRLEKGQNVFIHGASGGVGSMAIQIAKILGAKVWASASTEKQDFLKSMGADHVVDYKKTSLEEIKVELGGQMNVFFDVVSNSSLMQCESMLARGGTYVTLLPSPSLLVGFMKSLFKSQRVRFVVVKSKKADLEQVGHWVEAGKLKPTVEKVFSFSEVPQAFGALESGRTKGKIAIELG